jgi:hypothetical protein
MIVMTEYEINHLIDKSIRLDGTYTGMSYEQGIKDALEWVLGEGPDPLENP